MSSDFLQQIAQPFCCKHCNYNTSNKFDYNKHLTTLKHKTNIRNATFSIEINQNVASKIAMYECIVCNYYSKNKSNYDKHLLTDKHINKITGEPNKTKHICSQCNKEYSNYNSLWKHKKMCNPVDNQGEPAKLQNVFTPSNEISPPTFSATDIFLEVLKESKELQQVLIEQNKELQNKLLEQNDLHHKQIIELASKQGSNTINSHNKTNNFNLQFYLNETCKDAMNIADFVNSVKLTIDDFETTGKLVGKPRFPLRPLPL